MCHFWVPLPPVYTDAHDQQLEGKAKREEGAKEVVGNAAELWEVAKPM